MSTYIFDLDDYKDNENNCLPQLLKIKETLPNFKVTLFTIPAEISNELIEETKKHDWIQLAVHGLHHFDNYEFAKLNYYETKEKLKQGYNSDIYVKGFKAPGWQISELAMVALKELDFWLAVQYSDDRLDGDVNGPYQPAVRDGLKFYAFNELPKGYEAIHGHTWNCCGNGIDDLMSKILALPQDSEFMFIDDFVNLKYATKRL